ncbi:MAG TPA: DUF1893 domain-containing protein [Smithellaceae bacterium]|nr:DUF1893 domain-containing protein [Smithellaceae bacterium]
MLQADFTKYSLALLQDDRIIFTSGSRGLRPLLDCLEKYRGQKDKLILHDKVIGLAAAKLVVYYGIIAGIQTKLASRPAKEFLDANGIDIAAGAVVENILTGDRRAICPGEAIALKTADPEDFKKQIMVLLGKR